MNRKMIGLGLMLFASAFFIFGSGWIMDHAYSGSDWMEAHEIGLIMGVPAFLVLLLTWRFPKFGSIVAVILGGLAFLFWAPGAPPLGDMEERLIWSLIITTLVYLIGALLVFISTRYQKAEMK
jgi:hypothetical protein